MWLRWWLDHSLKVCSTKKTNGEEKQPLAKLCQRQAKSWFKKKKSGQFELQYLSQEGLEMIERHIY